MGERLKSTRLLRGYRSPMLRQTFVCTFIIVLLRAASLCDAQGCTCGKELVGRRIYGFPVAQYFNTPAASSCCAFCLAHPHCSSYTWNTTGWCSLMEKTDIADAFILASYTSGFKIAAILTTPATLRFSRFSSADPILVQRSADRQFSEILLTSGPNQSGLAMLWRPVQLLRDVRSTCQAASFTTAFSFMKAHTSGATPGSGFTFQLLAADTSIDKIAPRDGRQLGFSSSYANGLRRPGAMAVEYDTYRDAASNDPDSSHIGVDLNYDTQSVIAVSTLPLNIELRDARIKYSWIDYDAPTRRLSVFLSYSSTKPSKPLLSYTLDLCALLRPPTCSACAATTTAYLGFSGGTSSTESQLTYIYTWTLRTVWPSTQPGTAIPTSPCTIMPSCKFSGFELAGSVNLASASPADCCSTCSAQPRCLAFSWQPSTCTLHTAGDIVASLAGPAFSAYACGERARITVTNPAVLSFPAFNASSPMLLFGSASLADNVLRLTSGSRQLGQALYRRPVQLVRDIDSTCEAASWTASFAFRNYNGRPGISLQEGFTFLVLASNLKFGVLGGTPAWNASNLGFGYRTTDVLPGSLAVEFDNWQTGPFDLAEPHVGVDIRYDPLSLKAVPTSTFGIALNDSLLKYVWVDYDGDLTEVSVYLSYSPIKPGTPILSYEIDMCEVLRPSDCGQACASVTTGYVGFSGATNYNFQITDISSFQFRISWLSDVPNTGGLQLGLVPTASTPQKLNQFFRYASQGYLSQTGVGGRLPSWLVANNWNWTVDAVSPIRDQKNCRACHVFAAAAAIESTFFLTFYPVPVPDVSEQQLVDCSSGGCLGGWPGDILDQAAIAPVVNELAYPYTAVNRTCSVPANPAAKYQLTSFEAVNFLNWFGLLLAVQQTPVIVNVEASSPSFLSYKGGIFEDESCYSQGVDHSVVIVGYDITNSPPFWILRNSWGSAWGEQGYMRMAIKPGDGVCGINTTPGYIPVVRATDPCNSNSYPKKTGIFNPDAAPGRLNPCGGGTCTSLPGSRNTCACPVDFVVANNTDGSTTCVPARPCSFLPDNPCQIGTCIDSGTKPGTYTCICPMGYDVGNVAIDNSVTCVPAAQVGGQQSYTVPADVVVTCARIYEVYGIRAAVFLAQNKGLLDCSKPLPAGTVVNVTNDIVNGCALPYAINLGDTCSSIASLFGLPALAGPNSPNPDLVCTALQPGQQVCIIRRSANDSSPPDIPLCTAPYTASANDTCASIIASKFSDAAEFFSLNPGLYCNNFNRFRVAGSGVSVRLGQRVCLAATSLGSILKGCAGRPVAVRRGDTCLGLIRKFYCGRRRLFQRLNKGWQCDDRKLLVGRQTNTRLQLCAPLKCRSW